MQAERFGGAHRTGVLRVRAQKAHASLFDTRFAPTMTMVP